nr:unnamed protein product [Callosobruchus analis]
MTSHERWLKFYTDFDEQITKSSQGSIFWSSSESDHDDITSESPIKRRRLSIGSSSSGRSEKSTSEIARSPVLNSNRKQESPVLSRTLRLDMSPILVNKFRKHHRKDETKLNLTPLYCTPDLFNSQPSQVIEDDIPDASQKSCKLEVDVTNATQISATQSSVVVEPVFSQNASIVADYGSENSNAMMTESSNSGSSSCYVPRKKRRYKKGSLAKKVYNMIQSQSFTCKVWQIYKNKSTSSDDTSIKCSVKKNWKEYGTAILECSVIGSSTERTILICLSPMTKITLEVDSVIEFFSPYIEKNIFYNNQDVTCYINVIKIHTVEI